MRILEHIVGPADEGRQIGRVIRSSMRLSYQQFSRLKAQGGLLLDGQSVHSNHIVRVGQRITLRLLDEPGSTAVAEAGPVDIVYQDDDLLVINKCAPLPCQSSPKQPVGTLENRLAHHFREQPAFVFRPVNRLDKGTSGLMVVARNPHAQMLLARQLHTEAFVREYLALVCGVLDPVSGTIDAPIGKASGATVRREVRPDGRAALTHYETIQAGGGLSLVRLRLGSGRTHQIRVHLSHMGCPVLGDFLYGQEDARLPQRFALHACHIRFIHPLTNQELRFDAEPPIEMQGIIDALE